MTNLPQVDIHRAQFAILDLLRHQPTARFSELCAASGLESDTFKFHLRKLINGGAITKTMTGRYSLTPSGKEYGNNFNSKTRSKQRQPKQSVIIVIESTDSQGRKYVLLQSRKRHPYWGMLGLITGALHWGLSPESTGAAELSKQTGLEVELKGKGFYRQIIRIEGVAGVQEDNFFTILHAEVPYSPPSNTWYAGHNEWIPLTTLATNPSIFPSAIEILDMLYTGKAYDSGDFTYRKENY